MEDLNKLLDSNEFIKNIKRMFLMKVIEEHNIEKVDITFNSDIKSFEIKIVKDENTNFFKYKVKRRRSKSKIKENKKLKLKNYEESENDTGKSKDNIEKKEDMNTNNSKKNKDNNDINSNNTKDNIKNKENKTINNIDINTNNNKNKDIPKSARENNQIQNKNVPNNKYEIIKNCSKLLEYIQMYIKLVGRIHYILINNTPKKAMIELNKIINELEKLKDIPDDLDKINDRLIDITNDIL